MHFDRHIIYVTEIYAWLTLKSNFKSDQLLTDLSRFKIELQSCEIVKCHFGHTSNRFLFGNHQNSPYL